MEGPVYPRALAARGIASAAPDAADRTVVDTIIFDELVNGVFTDAGRAAYHRVIEHLAAEGCDAVALVCTEIPLLVTPEIPRRCPRWTPPGCRRAPRSTWRSARARCRRGAAVRWTSRP